MNTRISKKLVFTFSILLAAIWLPLSTFANNMVAITPAPENATKEGSIGFSETDPSEQLSVNVVTVRQTSQQLPLAGFAETDPANSSTHDDWSMLQSSKNQEQQVHIGFDEIDPSANSDQLYCLDDSLEEQAVQISRVFSSSDIPGQ